MFTTIFIIVLLIVLWIMAGFILEMLYAMHYREEPNEVWYKIATAAINATMFFINKSSK